jgi:hypothetical protein
MAGRQPTGRFASQITLHTQHSYTSAGGEMSIRKRKRASGLKTEVIVIMPCCRLTQPAEVEVGEREDG